MEWALSLQAKTRIQLLIIFLPVILLKLIFLISYPLNLSGDGHNYYAGMLLPGRALLVHAGGYPFLWGMFLHNFRYLVDVNPILFELIYVASQQFFDLVCLVMLYKVVFRYFGWGVGVVSLYFSGLSVFYLSFASMTLPEWLQADLWLLFMISLVMGVQRDEHSRNLFFILSVMLLELAYLVKFNSLILITLYLPVFLIEKSRGRIFSLIKNLLIGTGAAIAIHLIYLYGYHYPTTGTYDLHYDAGRVLIVRVNSLVSPENGINTKRLFALNGGLPEKYTYEKHYPYLYRHIEAVPTLDRESYRKLYQEILSKQEFQLDKYIANHPPWKKRQLYSYVLRVQYYVGLKEGDDLGSRVAYEAIVSHPKAYITSIFTSLFRIRPDDWRPRYLPSIADLDKNAQLVGTGESEIRYYAVPYYSWHQVFRTNQPVSWFWKPGLDFLNTISLSTAWPTLGILFFGTGFSLYELLIKRNIRLDVLVFSTLLGFVILFDFASNVILIFRAKELRAVYPLIGVCVGLGSKFAFEAGARVWTRIYTRNNYTPQGNY